jgi:hypothetical protein
MDVVAYLFIFFSVSGLIYSLIRLYQLSVELYVMKRKHRIIMHNMIANMEAHMENRENDIESAVQ